MSGGQGGLKPSPGNFFGAFIPSLLPMAISLVVGEHVGRRHFFSMGFRTLSCGKAEKSRSADQSSLTP